MSLRNLPEIGALNAPAGAQWSIPSSALERFRPLAADESATVNIFEGIGEQLDGSAITAKRIAGILRANKGRDITVAINSPGGDFFEGIAIYNLLREHDARVTVKVVGLAASAASIIAMAGDEIQIAKSGFMMIHNSWSIVVGNRHDLKEAIAVLEPFDDAMAEVYAARTGIEKRAVAKMMDADTWIGGNEAVEIGFADALFDADVKEDEERGKKNAALRALDVALARQGITRTQRRAMLAELSGGKPCAATSITPCADADMVALHELNFLFQGV